MNNNYSVLRAKDIIAILDGSIFHKVGVKVVSSQH